jgi:hypothetical protein
VNKSRFQPEIVGSKNFTVHDLCTLVNSKPGFASVGSKVIMYLSKNPFLPSRQGMGSRSEKYPVILKLSDPT